MVEYNWRLNMEIRILEPKDAEMYKVIRLEALQKHPEAYSSSYEEELGSSVEKYRSRLNDEHSFTFGAVEESQLVGVVTLVVEKKKKINHRANIVAVYVDHSKRRSGIARSLMLEAIKKAQEIESVEQIYLTVTSSNEPAKNLYQSLRFKTYGLDKRALKIGSTYFDDELMMLVL
jgi:ribosomal protein S18 acetylase RimI-like enzyme